MYNTMHYVTTPTGTAIYWAKSEDDAYNMWVRDHQDPGVGGIMIEQVLTDQGYPIVRLRDIRRGSFFHRINKRMGGEYCELSTVWCKGEYDRSDKKFECYKYEDVNDFRLLRGDTLVTIDFTF